MTDMNPREAFFKFVKNHDLFADLEFLDQPLEGQEIIAVRGESFEADDGVVIDPDYDEIINGFMNITYDRWAVNHVYNLVEFAKKSDKEKQLLATALTEYIIIPLINSNINSEKVYFVIGHTDDWKNLSWAHKVIEA
jgi:hypothetical protein